jgi:hypothetical protein
VIEYHAAGQRFSSKFSYWQLFTSKSKYKVGDEVEILYNLRNPSRFILNSWDSWITYRLSRMSGRVAERRPGSSS